jgi:predicted transcriptional regulator
MDDLISDYEDKEKELAKKVEELQKAQQEFASANLALKCSREVLCGRILEITNKIKILEHNHNIEKLQHSAQVALFEFVGKNEDEMTIDNWGKLIESEENKKNGQYFSKKRSKIESAYTALLKSKKSI